jgi:hypothetical protein
MCINLKKFSSDSVSRFVLQKKSLTEEEKKIKAELIAFQAEEMRKKKIRDRRTKIKQAMVCAYPILPT